MRDLFEQWLEFQTGLLPSSRDTYRHTAAPFFSWAEKKGLGLALLLPEHIADYMGEAIKDNSANVVKGRVNLLRGFFDWLVLKKLMGANPVQRAFLPKFRRVKPDKVPFTYEEYQLVLQEVSRPDSPWFAWWPAAVRIGWHTGLRCGDVAHLEWDSVDFAKLVMTVWPRKKRGVGEKLVIPMEPELVRFMSLIDREDDRYVLPKMRWRFDGYRTEVPKEFRKICNALGLIRHSFHGFRHSFVTRLLNAGVDSIIISSMTGQTVNQIREYAHVSTDAKVRALAASRQFLTSQAAEVKVV